jgi:hypothetical protein
MLKTRQWRPGALKSIIWFRLAACLFAASLSAAATAEPQTACAYLTSLVPEEGGPLFLPSYPTAEPGPLRGVAFLYDDAVAAIALIGCGEPGRARRIGDAILAALDHDRAWHDGRLRNAYAAGLVPAGGAGDGPVKLGGWWDQGQGRWLEDAYQVGSDAGNMAWAMLALLALDRSAPDRRYRDGAARIGDWVARRADIRGEGGYAGGFQGWEPAPTELLWKSTEHNTDLAAAFTLLSSATGDPIWQIRAANARGFVLAMWDPQDGGFGTGTGTDGVTRNTLLALDADIWPLLALPGVLALHGTEALATADLKLRSGDGYAYSEAGPGIWTEGTAQMALLQKLTGRATEAERSMRAIETARAPGGAYFATAHETLATGFADPTNPKVERYYLHLPHLAAAGWTALAERGFNPFTASAALP